MHQILPKFPEYLDDIYFGKDKIRIFKHSIEAKTILSSNGSQKWLYEIYKKF